jgi:hypothetical protein
VLFQALREEGSMRDKNFKEQEIHYTLADYMHFDDAGRSHMGAELSVIAYRLLEYALREELTEKLGAEAQTSLFRGAGRRAGVYFAENILDTTLSSQDFLAQLQAKFRELKLGILRFEKIDSETGSVILTIAEDADCSGLPILGKPVCSYDEGFISGVLSAYSRENYQTREVDCWATGSDLCRFQSTKKRYHT